MPFLTAAVWELVTLMLAICHLILTAGCLTFTLKAVIHEPRGTVVATVDGLAVKSLDGTPRPLVCHGL